jgi:hypothetical protein
MGAEKEKRQAEARPRSSVMWRPSETAEISAVSQPVAVTIVSVSRGSVQNAAAVKRCDSELHEKVKRGVTPEINAVCTMLIAIGVVIASVLQKASPSPIGERQAGREVAVRRPAGGPLGVSR